MGAVRAQTWQRSGDDEIDTGCTLALMAELAREDSTNARVKEAAAEAISQAPRNPAAWAAAVWRWVKRNVTLVSDEELARPVLTEPEAKEVLIRPLDLLAMRRPAGDCDDFSMLVASMLDAVGIPSMFVATAPAGERARPGSRYSHVYVEAVLPQGIMPLDASHGPAPAWRPGPQGKRRVQPVQAGLGAIDWGATITSGIQTAGEILKARFAVPPVGTYIQTPEGTLYRQQPGAAAISFPGAGISGAGGNLVLILAGVAGLLLVARLFK